MPNLYDEYTVAGKEVSSTYEGRHVTYLESYLTHPSHTDGFVDKGDPVVAGDIIGVALGSAATANDEIAIDTEGIWALDVVATDQDGNVAVARGDEIFINTSTAVLSKNYDKNTQQHFGYALTTLNSGSTDVVVVKIHWSPDYAEEQVGTSSVPYAMGAETIAREYRYSTALTSGDVRGMYVQLNPLSAGVTADALRSRAQVGEVACTQAIGIHAGVDFSGDTLGRITGLSAGGRFTYLANNRGQTGTICGGMSELWADGTSTDFGTAVHSIHRFVMDGDATGYATADNVFEFVNLSNVQYAANTDTPDHALRCVINGNVRYIMVSEAQA